ncbi:MAG: hypothetical protein EAZ57_11080 [Cytophagales bacterium]|nr:MAG: hypothetical protein EAZ67_11565 [Cytophagales bacterium]TAF59512.1 MAG: hypothetical protein EAZ57_11080 [Cytophagales bacterium]
MVKHIAIKNFKSIKDVSFEAKRVNLLLGTPNSGKSNILEALGLFSASYVRNLKDFIRFKKTENLFFDNDVTQDIQIAADDYLCHITYDKGIFRGKCNKGEENYLEFRLNYGGEYDRQVQDNKLPFKYYRFKLDYTASAGYDYLLPPFGKNLFSILYTNKSLRKEVSQLLLEKGFRLIIDTQDKKIEILKEVDDIFYTYPYESLSDTIQRVVFYLTAMSTNSNSVLLFEEPEAYIFPYYVKFLADKIIQDNSNQYFIITHNPYLLFSMMDSLAESDLGVFMTSMRDYRTEIKPLTMANLEKVRELGNDFFLNPGQII